MCAQYREPQPKVLCSLQKYNIRNMSGKFCISFTAKIPGQTRCPPGRSTIGMHGHVPPVTPYRRWPPPAPPPGIRVHPGRLSLGRRFPSLASESGIDVNFVLIVLSLTIVEYFIPRQLIHGCRYYCIYK